MSSKLFFRKGKTVSLLLFSYILVGTWEALSKAL